MKPINLRDWIAISSIFVFYIVMMIIVVTIVIRINNETILMNIFTVLLKLFTNIITAVLTFYFTSKLIGNTKELE